MAGCTSDTGDCYARIGAAITAPVVGVRDGAFLGACPRWVEIDGANWTVSDYAFDFAPDDLVAIGEATRVSVAAGRFDDRTTYAIDGLVPGEVVVMGGQNGAVIIVTRDMGWSGDELPVELCPKLAANSDTPPPCPAPIRSP